MNGILMYSGNAIADRPESLVIVRESAVSLEPEQSWKEFLDRLRRPRGPATVKHIAAVRQIWDMLRFALGTRLPLPLTQSTHRGAIQLAWDAGRHYVEIDVLSDGRVEWFYRDRETNTLDGTEDEPVAIIPYAALIERLKMVLP